MSRLVASGVAFAFREHAVLEEIDVALGPGTVTLLAGRNGSGKSTLLGLLAGLRAPARGAVELDGRSIGQWPARARARTVTMLPQDSDTVFEFTGCEVVMMGRHPHIPRFGAPGAEDHAAVRDALARVDAEGFAGRSVQTLSGGELRRIHIARALATRAPILLADEPTANLDLEHAVAILALLRELAGAGHTVVVSSHDLNLTAPRCDRIMLLHERRLVADGTPEAVLTEERVAQVFGVRSGPAPGSFPRHFVAAGPR